MVIISGTILTFDRVGMDVDAIDQLSKIHTVKSFIFIDCTQKEGKPQSVNEYSHRVDLIVQVGKGKATTIGRFNAGEVRKFEIVYLRYCNY